MELIKSYAVGLAKSDFWEVYGEHLQSAADNISKRPTIHPWVSSLF